VQTKLFSTWIDNINNKTGKALLKELFDGFSPFEYPKPVDLIKRIVKMGNAMDGIVLDFFSGSATTAHAVMEMNAEDGDHRTFIMVQ
jgi:adenine-specific DNA-methyltransferase